MNDDALRALVRDAVARHLGQRGGSVQAGSVAMTVAAPAAHPSHALYVTLVNVDDACVIEPSVGCDHCGYCKSHGH